MARTAVVMLVHEADGVLGASFPDYPGAVAVARDVGTLRARAAATLAAHLDALHAAASPVRAPRTASELERSPAFREAARTGTVTTLELLLPNAAPERRAA